MRHGLPDSENSYDRRNLCRATVAGGPRNNSETIRSSELWRLNQCRAASNLGGTLKRFDEDRTRGRNEITGMVLKRTRYFLSSCSKHYQEVEDRNYRTCIISQKTCREYCNVVEISLMQLEDNIEAHIIFTLLGTDKNSNKI